MSGEYFTSELLKCLKFFAMNSSLSLANSPLIKTLNLFHSPVLSLYVITTNSLCASCVVYYRKTALDLGDSGTKRKSFSPEGGSSSAALRSADIETSPLTDSSPGTGFGNPSGSGAKQPLIANPLLPGSVAASSPFPGQGIPG